MTRSPEILALGEALIEFVQITADDDRPTYRQGFGGDTSNAIIAAARQGASTGYLSAVGGDPFGDKLLALWRREGVDIAGVHTRPQDPTGVYFVQPHASGRSFSYARRGSAASLYGPKDLPEEMIRQARVLHVSALSQAVSPSLRAAVKRAAEIARAAGTLVSFDTNLRLNLWTLDTARQAIFDLLPLADIVFPSDDEAEQLTGTSDPAANIARFQSHGATVLFKRGAQGPVLAQGERRLNVPAPKVAARDSTGAGDSFAGAYLAYLLETGDPGEAARRAALVAAGTVAGLGAVDPIPHRSEILSDSSS